VEKNHLLNEFYRIVLVHPDVEFSFMDNDEEIFHLPVSNTRLRIEQVFQSGKKKLTHQLLNIETSTGLVSVKGFIGRPEYAQKSSHQYFFVNGRYMRHPYFHKAVMLAYNQLIQPTDNPMYFIYFDVDPQSIDINIHPTKTEIKFENEQAIWSILSATVKEALGKFNIVPSIDFDREGVPEMPVGGMDKTIVQPKTEFNSSYNPFGGGTYKRPALNWQDLYADFEKKDDKVVLPDAAFFPDEEVIQSKLNIEEEDSSGKYFQLKNRYIITSVKSGMLVIDQRRAHIRILFDGFLKEIQQKKGVSQQLIFPESLLLMPGDIQFFEQIKAELKYTGFDFESVSTGNYEVKGIPSQLKGTDAVIPLLNEVIEKVKQATGDAVSSIQDQLALTLAEASAIRTFQKLSEEAMADIFQKLFACQLHNHTPDGKLIMTIISIDEILEKFR
jgi:DNA mismatch repair protein MutL